MSYTKKYIHSPSYNYIRKQLDEMFADLRNPDFPSKEMNGYGCKQVNWTEGGQDYGAQLVFGQGGKLKSIHFSYKHYPCEWPVLAASLERYREEESLQER